MSPNLLPQSPNRTACMDTAIYVAAEGPYGTHHIDCTRTVTHCVSICMDSCRFICTVGHSADLCMDVYGDLLLF